MAEVSAVVFCSMPEVGEHHPPGAEGEEAPVPQRLTPKCTKGARALKVALE